MISTTFMMADAASEPAQRAMQSYFAELTDRFTQGFEPGDALESAARTFTPPSGSFVLVMAGQDIVGCGAVQFLDDDTAEAKRMWIDPVARGQGLGRALLDHLESEARRAGCNRLLLDTNSSLTEALSLYSRQGYSSIPKYNDNPHASHWFAKSLA